jgi:hypothetical protein
MFCYQHLKLFHGEAEVGTLDSNEAYAQVLERYIEVWFEVSWRSWSEAIGIYKIRFGREYSRQKDHLGVLLYLGINSDYMV